MHVVQIFEGNLSVFHSGLRQEHLVKFVVQMDRLVDEWIDKTFDATNGGEFAPFQLMVPLAERLGITFWVCAT